MTIEIRQLIIRAVVHERPGQAGSTGAIALPEPRTALAASLPRVPPAMPAEEREAIVAACVREVLRRIERARER